MKEPDSLPLKDLPLDLVNNPDFDTYQLNEFNAKTMTKIPEKQTPETSIINDMDTNASNSKNTIMGMICVAVGTGFICYSAIFHSIMLFLYLVVLCQTKTK